MRNDLKQIYENDSISHGRPAVAPAIMTMLFACRNFLQIDGKSRLSILANLASKIPESNRRGENRNARNYPPSRHQPQRDREAGDVAGAHG